jgi:hypothetical protein
MNYLKRIIFTITVFSALVGCNVLIPTGKIFPQYSPDGLIKVLITNIAELRYPRFVEGSLGAKSAAPIPISTAYYEIPRMVRYLCDQFTDPSCVSIAIGEEIKQYPQVLEKIKKITSDPCPYLPETSSISSNSNLDIRRKENIEREDLIEAKKYLSCNDSSKLRRNVTFVIIKNSDETLNYFSEEKLRNNIIEKFIISIN